MNSFGSDVAFVSILTNNKTGYQEIYCAIDMNGGSDQRRDI